MQLNPDFKQELENTKIETLKAPSSKLDRNNPDLKSTLTEEQLFGKEAVDGELPKLTQDFVILKSKQDKLIEMGQIAQEVYQTKKVSRKQVLAIESLARDLVEQKEERTKVVVDSHEVNMFTEEPSSVEVETVIENSRVAVDEIVGNLKNSTTELATKIIDTIDKDRVSRKDNLQNSIAEFNTSVIEFLTEKDKDTFENVDFKFKRNLKFSDLLSFELSAVRYSESDNFERTISTFDGTAAESFLKTLIGYLQGSNNSYNVVRVFVNGISAVVPNSEIAEKIINNSKEENSLVTYRITVGDLLAAFGDSRFNKFYTYLDSIIEENYNNIKELKENIIKATKVEDLISLSNCVNTCHKNILDCTGNMGVLNYIQLIIVKLLKSF